MFAGVLVREPLELIAPLTPARTRAYPTSSLSFVKDQFCRRCVFVALIIGDAFRDDCDCGFANLNRLQVLHRERDACK